MRARQDLCGQNRTGFSEWNRLSQKLVLRPFVYAMAMAVTIMSSAAYAGDFAVSNFREARQLKQKLRASQFLHRATFGPTMEEIEELANRMRQIGERRAMNEWIDDQFDVTMSSHQDLALQMIEDDGFETTQGDVWIQRYRYHAWWDIAVRGEDQLRQRVAWALAQILVTSEDGAGFNDRTAGNITGIGRWLAPSNYYDTLTNGAFGNYRDLLKDVTYHPVMGVYLSHMRNRRTNGVRFPDENYAREIMQLFTIGLYEMNQDGSLKTDNNGDLIPTYDNEDIKEFARVFTGLAFEPRPEYNSNAQNNFLYGGNDFQLPMRMFDEEHDSEPKTLLNGEVVDLEDGDQDVQAAIDNLFNHNNIAPFISYRLIQRLVKSNPTRGYIRRVARKFENNGRGVRGDMKAVVKAILTDSEAFRSVRMRTIRSGSDLMVRVTPRGTNYSRLREPVIRYTHFLRSVKGTSTYPGGKIMMFPLDYNWTQEAYKQPTVFSFFLPSYQPPGLGEAPVSRRLSTDKIVAPEFQMKTAVTSNRLMNRYIWNISARNVSVNVGNNNYRTEFQYNFDLAEEDQMASTEETMMDLVDHLDILHCSGTMPQDFKQKLVDVINTQTNWMKNNSSYAHLYAKFRTDAALLNTILSPFAAVQE